jgi:hypothetical protein
MANNLLRNVLEGKKVVHAACDLATVQAAIDTALADTSHIFTDKQTGKVVTFFRAFTEQQI